MILQRTWIVLIGLLMSVACATAGVADEASRRSRRTPVVKAFEKSRNAVVNISATRIVTVRRSPSGFYSLFDQMFDLPVDRYARTSVGSGVVIHPDGYIVTNAHVVAKTADRKVIFADGRELDAEIVALDTEHDLAVLSVDSPTQLEMLKLGRSDDLMIGETVIAVGNPLGYQNTVTVGVVSALNRTLQFSEKVAYGGLIQTDASINPGNSGGPLLNINGELIGINTAIRGDAQNIGFAIPVDQLRRLLPEILDLPRLKQAWIGMQVGGGDEARITRVEADGPADQAGLKVGDLITAVDGHPTARDIDVYLELLSKEAGDRVRLAVFRAPRSFDINLRVAPVPPPDGERLARRKFGLTLRRMSDVLVRKIGLRSGVMILEVEPGGPGDRIGLKRGDILYAIGRFYASDLEITGQLLQKLDSGDLVEISVLRAGQRRLEKYAGTIQIR